MKSCTVMTNKHNLGKDYGRAQKLLVSARTMVVRTHCSQKESERKGFIWLMLRHHYSSLKKVRTGLK